MTITTNRKTTVVPATFVALSLLAAACGSDNDSTTQDTQAPAVSDAPEDTEAPTDTEAPVATDTSDAQPTALADVCPSPIVLQTDWFPQPEHGAVYQLAGVDGDVDGGNGVYTGTIGDTGVELEIRVGGPFVGFQFPSSIMYQDDGIHLGYVPTDEAIRFSKDLPVIGIATPLEINPQVFMWDPEVYDLESIDDVRASGAVILHFEGAAYVDWLKAEGLVDPAQLDSSDDGSGARFFAEGDLIQQGFATNEPFFFENIFTEEWGRPVGTMLMHDEGFRIYAQVISGKPAVIEEYHDCWEQIVPLLQQAQIDYIQNPLEVNTFLIEYAEALNDFWFLTPESTAWAAEEMLRTGIVSNGPDSTLGEFEPDRIQEALDILNPFHEAEGTETWDPNVSVDSITTNEFIDPDIGL